MKYVAGALVAWFALGGILHAQTKPAPEPTAEKEIPATGKADPRLTPLDELMTRFVRERSIPGAALAVTKDGRLVYARGFGYADLAEKAPVAPHARFRIASISKPITAVAVLQLVEQGRLGLDEKVFDRLKLDPHLTEGTTFDERLNLVTVRQLLQHTGGFDRDVSFDPMFRSVEIARELGAPPPAEPAHVIRYMLGRRLDFDPGERYAYSNIGYCILGRLIESTTGEPYEKYVQAHVLGPLGIRRMQLGKTLLAGRADDEVRYYVVPEETAPAVVGEKIGEPIPWPYGGWYLEAMDAHGGWIASAVDLVRFARAFDHPERCPVLGARSISEMFARPGGEAGCECDGRPKEVYYGCGWLVRPVGTKGRTNQWHTGSLDGTSTILVRRHDGLDWAVLFNTRNGPREKGTDKEEVPARAIDPLVHQAVDAVTAWPEGDLFEGFP